MRQLTILGLGLIGGSIALRARRHGLRVFGVDFAETLALPEAARAAELVDARDERRVAELVEESDLVILSAPVGGIMRSLPLVLPRARLLTDCGSTKRQVVLAAQRVGIASHFVPGHPMAGAPEGGVVHAREDLFEGRTWILCPEQADPDAVARVSEFITGLGARIVHMSMDEHDRSVALTSHVPQVLASVLMVLAQRHDAFEAAGPAFTSATRVAGGPPAMWKDIFETNADEISRALRALSGELVQIADALQRPTADRTEQVIDLLMEARELRSMR